MYRTTRSRKRVAGCRGALGSQRSVLPFTRSTMWALVGGGGAPPGLEQIVESSKLPVAELHETMAALKEDPDTYFVSAEAHERWRGALQYDDYPMRRIASIQLFKRF